MDALRFFWDQLTLSKLRDGLPIALAVVGVLLYALWLEYKDKTSLFLFKASGLRFKKGIEDAWVEEVEGEDLFVLYIVRGNSRIAWARGSDALRIAREMTEAGVLVRYPHASH